MGPPLCCFSGCYATVVLVTRYMQHYSPHDGVRIPALARANERASYQQILDRYWRGLRHELTNARDYLVHEGRNTIRHRERRQASRALYIFKAHLIQRNPKRLAMHQGIERAIMRTVQHGDRHWQRVPSTFVNDEPHPCLVTAHRP